MIDPQAFKEGQHFELLMGIERNEMSPRMHEIGLMLGGTTFELGLIGRGDPQPVRIHSESVYHDNMCPYFLLGCIEKAQQGGDNVIYDAVQAAEIIDIEHPELREVIMVYHAEHYDSTKATVPLVRNIDGVDFLGFRQKFPLNEVTNLPPGWDEDAFYDYVDGVLGRCIEFEHCLDPGEVLVVNNYRTLHVRKAYEGLRKIIRVRVDDPAYDEHAKTLEESSTTA